MIYVAQPITKFLGDSFCLEDNYHAALEYANKVYIGLLGCEVNFYSPAISSIPFALYDLKNENKLKWQNFIDIDNRLIDEFRKNEPLRWLFPTNWYKSKGCIAEFQNALEHNEDIRFYRYNEETKKTEITLDHVNFNEEHQLNQIFTIAKIQNDLAGKHNRKLFEIGNKFALDKGASLK